MGNAKSYASSYRWVVLICMFGCCHRDFKTKLLNRDGSSFPFLRKKGMGRVRLTGGARQ